MAQDDPNPIGDDLHDALRREDATGISIRLEKRRYGKDVTVIDGFAADEDLRELARTLKRRLATGGSSKEDRIELQGDLIARVRAELAALGYPVA